MADAPVQCSAATFQSAVTAGTSSQSRAFTAGSHPNAHLGAHRGNMLVLRMLSRPQKSMTTRSRPTPQPPWGGAPYLGTGNSREGSG